MQTIDIICPVFREEAVIERFHKRLSAAIEDMGARYQVRILYVLDPSPDGTEEILAGISAQDASVEIMVMSRRFGHQAALIAGIELSRADAVVMLDSDLQHPPELINDLVSHWERGAEVVQAIRQDGTETGAFKRWTSRFFYHVLGKASGVQLAAGASDYRLLSRRVCEVVGQQLTEQNPFLRGLVSWVGFKTATVTYWPSARGGGRSKYTASTLVNFAINGIFSFSKLPLRVCIVLGFAMAALSFLVGFIQIALYLSGTLEVPGWASLFTAVSLIGGMQLFFFGVSGEYLGLIFDEVKARPRYLVDRHYRAGGILRPGRAQPSRWARKFQGETENNDYGT